MRSFMDQMEVCGKKIHQILLLIALFVVLINYIQAESGYCTIPTCKPATHTLCKYENQTEEADACGLVLQPSLDLSEKNRILFLHNIFRSYVYSGKEKRGKRGPQYRRYRFDPNMPEPMVWDPQLEMIAQKWVEQCIFSTDECRNVVRFDVGQNIGRESTFDDIFEVEVDAIIEKWTQGVIHFNKRYTHSFSIQNEYYHLTKEYTQMVWQKSTNIGCAGIRYLEPYSNEKFFLIACNYGPAGNIPYKKVYEI